MKGLWALRVYAKRYWKGIVVAFLFMGANAYLTYLVIGKTLPVFEGLFAHLEQASGPERAQHLHTVLYNVLILLAVVVGTALAQAVSGYMGDWLGQNVLFSLRSDVFHHLQELSMRFYEKRRSGELVSRVNNDTMVLQGILGSSLTGLVVCPLTALALIAKMGMLSWRLTLVMALVGPAVVILTRQLGGYLRRYSHQVQSALADLTANVEENFFLMRVIKMFGLKRIMNRRFDCGAREVYRAEMRGARMRSLNSAAVGMFVGVALCGVLLFGAYEIIGGRMTGAMLMTFVFAMQMVASQINRLARVFMALERGEAAALRTLELLEEVPEVQDSPQAVEVEDLRGEIRFEKVTFAYEAERPVLKDLDLQISPGQVVALVGPSGAGKTTIAGLVPRLYDVQAGRVLVDDRDVRDFKQESLRSFMGFVPQETMLFAGTVRDNIAFARPEASEQEIRAAAQAANATGFIEALPEGYDTQVGEMGVRLSGGQQQRIAIARALLRNPRILILDEATSSLDQASEQVVHQALNTLLQGRTALIIAHRLSTVQNADRILVIDDGRVVEEGTHDQLMQAHGLYWQLYESLHAEEEGQPQP